MTPIVIMAGGRGLRLDPLTARTPKPLLGVGGKPILEQIIGRFADQGFKRFWLCVGYKAELITAHFGNGEEFGVKIQYVHEIEPLGTGGALRLLPKFDVPFILSNADVLTTMKFGPLMEAHARANAEATICLSLYLHQIPFGVAQFDEHSVYRGLLEKPIHEELVNAGIYVISPEALEKAPQGAFGMPQFLDRLSRVSVYPVTDDWRDVGTFEDYGRAHGELS